MTNLTKHLLAEVNGFMASTGMTPTEFGIRAVNDGHVVRDLRAGKDMRASRIDRIRAFMASYDACRRASA